MQRHNASLRIGLASALALGLVAAGFEANAQVPPVQPAAGAAAPLPPAPLPPPPGVEPLPAPSDAATQRLDQELTPRTGGLKSADVARKAEMSSPDVRAKQMQVTAAAARVDQAVVSYFPRLGFNARFVQMSPITLPTLGNVVGAQAPGPIFAACNPVTNQCTVTNAAAVPLSFTSVNHMYALQGTLAIPLSDYLLRITQNHRSASTSESAARLTEAATRLKVQRDARVAYYNWIRARGAIVVAEQGLETVKGHLKDVSSALQVGTASRADQMRVESQLAAMELAVERAKNLAVLAEEQLRVMMHDPPGTRYEIGESITAAGPAPSDAELSRLMQEATAARLEPRALEETARSVRLTRKVLQAGYLPRVDGFANLYHQNPNTRYFPQQDVWHTTWDVGVQLSWTVNDSFTANSQVAEVEAKAAEIDAQANLVRDAIRMEVTQAYNAVREAQTALGTSARQILAAQESLRVRRELFRNGRATSAEYTDAETDLIRSQLDLLNARVDAKIGQVALDHAVGRDVQGR
ncbi:MAG: TolC family protein [Deltaproteobacteria bacterium]|nr:TolC family protein [Deltaproteobacteria bacterium]